MEKAPGVQTASAGPGQQQDTYDLGHAVGGQDTYDLGHAAGGQHQQQQPPQAYLDIAPRPELNQAAAPAQHPRALAAAGRTSYDHDDESEEEI